MKLLRHGSALLLACTLATSPAFAEADEAATIPQAQRADPPRGYVEMCERNATLCELENLAAPQQIVDDRRSLLRLLRQVNQSVNRRLRFERDAGEYWTAVLDQKGATGDCEDFAITKRLQLLRHGFPADQLSYAVAYVPRVGLHTVLVAQVEGEDFVLDNRTPWIQRWSRTPYVWLLKQSFAQASVWYSTYASNDAPIAVAPAAKTV